MAEATIQNEDTRPLAKHFRDKSSVSMDDRVRLSDEPPPPPPPEIIEGKAWNAIRDLKNYELVENSDEITSRLRARLEQSPTAREFLERLDEKGGKLAVADLGKPSANGGILFGSFDPDTGILLLNSHLTEDMMLLTAAHELTHSIPQSANSSYLNRNVEQMNDYTPLGAAGWLFGAEAAAETTSILIAYELKQAGDGEPYDVALNYNEHMEDLLGLDTDFLGLRSLQEALGVEIVEFDPYVDMRDEAMIQAFDKNLDQGIEFALAKAYDTWLTHPSGVGSYVSQAKRLYEKSLDHVGYNKEYDIYIKVEHQIEDIGTRSLSDEELRTVTTIGPHNILPHLTINPGNDEHIHARIEENSSYQAGEFTKITANVAAYNETNTPPNGRTAYNLDDVVEYYNSDFQTQLEFYEYVQAKQDGTLEYIDGYFNFRENNPSTSENIFFNSYIEFVNKGILPLPELPETIEDFAQKFGEGISDINIKLAYSGALHSGDHRIIQATEAIFEAIDDHYGDEPEQFRGRLIQYMQDLNMSEIVHGSDLDNIFYEMSDHGDGVDQALLQYVDAHLIHYGLFQDTTEIPAHMQDIMASFEKPMISNAYKCILEHGTPEQIQAAEQAFQNLAGLTEEQVPSYARDEAIELVAYKLAGTIGPDNFEWPWAGDIDYELGRYPDLAQAIESVASSILTKDASDTTIESAPKVK